METDEGAESTTDEASVAPSDESFLKRSLAEEFKPVMFVGVRPLNEPIVVDIRPVEVKPSGTSEYVNLSSP